MRIGAVASVIGVSRDTLRRLEREGVMTPLRDRVGHRRFSEADIERIRAALFSPKGAKRSALK
jgi:excisionase family DNA binding protein